MPFGDNTYMSPFSPGAVFTSSAAITVRDDVEDRLPPSKSWSVIIRHGMLTVGCQTHSFRDWWNFTDAEIEAMHEQALIWWRCNKDNVFNLLITMGLWSDKDEAPTWQDDWF
jgi:hypothetical protein